MKRPGHLLDVVQSISIFSVSLIPSYTFLLSLSPFVSVSLSFPMFFSLSSYFSLLPLYLSFLLFLSPKRSCSLSSAPSLPFLSTSLPLSRSHFLWPLFIFLSLHLSLYFPSSFSLSFLSYFFTAPFSHSLSISLLLAF